MKLNRCPCIKLYGRLLFEAPKINSNRCLLDQAFSECISLIIANKSFIDLLTWTCINQQIGLMSGQVDMAAVSVTQPPYPTASTSVTWFLDHFDFVSKPMSNTKLAHQKISIKGAWQNGRYLLLSVPWGPFRGLSRAFTEPFKGLQVLFMSSKGPFQGLHDAPLPGLCRVSPCPFTT